ncbi:GLPGLI family protein [Mucilaginibacter sp. dw_454]|uniref:GLPGLI family protein n=1 Tax=Mucilaginibacter sp. dw_454 TaxID=2720079 RepID=UPI001BD4EEA7|nr:GLPGLI family protein [Mucilaginibacter sp. dw_454]
MKNFVKTILFLFALHSGLVLAQGKQFITGGTIEFEKTQNMFAIMKNKATRDDASNKGYYEEYLKSRPQFLTYNSTLIFNANSSLFTPIPGKSIEWMYDAPIAEQLNTVYNDFTHGTTTTQKEFYERTYLIKDTLRKIKWKITDETQTVAGYNCRRANGLVLDSIYVVAFYAEDIHVSSGPESFTGLPGMILKLSLPHEHVSWVATKVSTVAADEKKLVPPKKGTVVNYEQMHKALVDAQSRWGEVGRYFIRGFSL